MYSGPHILTDIVILHALTKNEHAEQLHQIDYAVDIYPHYGSDVGAAWRSGMDCRAALIGPGVHASHGMERTHLDALRATMDLAALYLELA